MLGVLAVAIAFTGGCEGRHAGVHAKGRERDPLTGPALVELNLAHGVPEMSSSALFGPSSGGSHADLVQTLTHIDPDRKSVV